MGRGWPVVVCPRFTLVRGDAHGGGGGRGSHAGDIRQGGCNGAGSNLSRGILQMCAAAMMVTSQLGWAQQRRGPTWDISGEGDCDGARACARLLGLVPMCRWAQDHRGQGGRSHVGGVLMRGTSGWGGSMGRGPICLCGIFQMCGAAMMGASQLGWAQRRWGTTYERSGWGIAITCARTRLFG